MPSPFPGMDPFLEDPSVWPDLHDRLAGEISVALNRSLPNDFYAQLGVREEIGIVDEGTVRRIVPDVVVRGSLDDQGGGGIAVEPRIEADPYIQIELVSEPREVNFIEIRDARGEHEIVTVIEILSPSNKRPGSDRDAYLRKRCEVLGSKTSLVEIDLLREGDRSFFGHAVRAQLAEFEPRPEYLVLVNRAWKRGARMSFEFYPVPLRQPLPAISVPLRQGEPDVTLDLQHAFGRAYEGGPYRRGAVNYTTEPPVDAGHRQWATERIASWQQTT